MGNGLLIAKPVFSSFHFGQRKKFAIFKTISLLQIKNGVRKHAIQQALAADGAIASFSSNLVPWWLNADRAPQLKRSVMRFRRVKCLRLVMSVQVRRLLISVGGGISIPILLLAFTSLVGEELDRRGMEWAVNLLFFSFMGPLKIWERVFPPPPCDSCGPTTAALVATIVTVFVIYASFTYLVRLLIERSRSGDARSLSERRA
jgi:hypothetical protein